MNQPRASSCLELILMIDKQTIIYYGVGSQLSSHRTGRIPQQPPEQNRETACISPGGRQVKQASKCVSFFFFSCVCHGQTWTNSSARVFRFMPRGGVSAGPAMRAPLWMAVLVSRSWWRRRSRPDWLGRTGHAAHRGREDRAVSSASLSGRLPVGMPTAGSGTSGTGRPVAPGPFLASAALGASFLSLALSPFLLEPWSGPRSACPWLAHRILADSDPFPMDPTRPRIVTLRDAC